MASNKPRQFKHPHIMVKEGEETQPVAAERLIEASDPGPHITALVWHGVKIVLRTMVSLTEFEQLTAMIVSQCWNGEYYQIAQMDFAIRCGVVSCYTNVTLPEDAEQAYALLYGTDLYETVYGHLNAAQLDALNSAVKMILGN